MKSVFSVFVIVSSGLLALGSQGGHDHAQQTPAKPLTAAEKAFGHYKSMEGKWEGEDKSSGRKIKLEYRVIANGSVVMEISDYDAHPNEQMVTMYSLDQGKLILTHYCVARNQPRLVAETISEDGKTIEFKFQSGTGMKDVNTGHMHNVKVWFVGPNDHKDQWSFYKDGKETFMEEFHTKRVK